MGGRYSPYFERDVEIRLSEIIIECRELLDNKPSGWKERRELLKRESSQIHDKEEPAGYQLSLSMEQRKEALAELIMERELEESGELIFEFDDDNISDIFGD